MKPLITPDQAKYCGLSQAAVDVAEEFIRGLAPGQSTWGDDFARAHSELGAFALDLAVLVQNRLTKEPKYSRRRTVAL